MGKGAKGLNIYFVIILLLLLVTVWVSTIQEKDESYTKGEFITQLEEGEVVGVEIHPNTQVPTGSVRVALKNGYTKTLYVSDVVEIQEILEEYNIDPVVEDVPQENWFSSSCRHHYCLHFVHLSSQT